MPLILVTGATGAVGPQVVTFLLQEGYGVRTLSADPPRENMFPSGVENIIGDITNFAKVQEAVKDVDAVIHLAALLHIFNPPDSMRPQYEQVNVGGTASIVKAAVEAHVRRIVFFSTIAVYGDSKGHILTEEAQPHPDTFYGHTKYEAERIVLGARSPDGQPLGCVLRCGAIYGARIKGNYLKLAQALAQHRFFPIGNGSNRRSLIYDKDVARATSIAVTHPSAAGRVYNVTDGEFHTLHEIIVCICSALGRRPPRLSVPLWTARAIIGLIEKVCGAIHCNPLVTQETLDKYTEDIAIDSSLIQKELGFRPKYTLKDGWDETVREMML